MPAFDATTAKQGSMWLTGGGSKVEFVAYLERASEHQQAVFLTQNGNATLFWSDGSFQDDSVNDIIGPAPETVRLPECWVVRWSDRGLWKSCSFASEYNANVKAAQYRGYITHIPAREVPAGEVGK